MAIGLFMLSVWLLSWPLTLIVQRLYGLDEPTSEGDK